MKDKEYVRGMLMRAERKRRAFLLSGNKHKMLEQAAVVRNLKIVLELPKNSGRGRLKKNKDDMDKLLTSDKSSNTN